MAEPRVIAVMREFKQGLLARDAQQMRTMTRRWLQAERALESDMAALAEEIARRRLEGAAVSRGMLFSLDRYRGLLAHTQDQIGQYQVWATGFITDGQSEMAQLGIDQATIAVEMALRDLSVEAQTFRQVFQAVPVEAVQYMVGLAGDGAPLFDVLRGRALFPMAAENLSQTLVEAVARGDNPRKTARAMAEGLSGGLDKALNIARTEQMRVYRAASDASYRHSGVVAAKRRMASKSPRTCLACLADDGRVYDLDEDAFDHNNGRCQFIPILRGEEAPEYETGRDWFERLPESEQREMMGPKLYELWAGGRGFDFERLATRTHDVTWGDSLRVASADELQAVRKAA